MKYMQRGNEGLIKCHSIAFNTFLIIAKSMILWVNLATRFNSNRK